MQRPVMRLIQYDSRVNYNNLGELQKSSISRELLRLSATTQVILKTRLPPVGRRVHAVGLVVVPVQSGG